MIADGPQPRPRPSSDRPAARPPPQRGRRAALRLRAPDGAARPLRSRRQEGTAYERYLAEIRVADAQLARVVRLLAERFPDRGVPHRRRRSRRGLRRARHPRAHEDALRGAAPRAADHPRPGVIAAPRRSARSARSISVRPSSIYSAWRRRRRSWGRAWSRSSRGGASRSIARCSPKAGSAARSTGTGSRSSMTRGARWWRPSISSAIPARRGTSIDIDRNRVDPVLAALRAFFSVHRASLPGYEPMYKP